MDYTKKIHVKNDSHVDGFITSVRKFFRSSTDDKKDDETAQHLSATLGEACLPNVRSKGDLYHLLLRSI